MAHRLLTVGGMEIFRRRGVAWVLVLCWAGPAHARLHLPVQETAAEVEHCAALDARMGSTRVDPSVRAYVETLGQEVLAASHERAPAFTFRVVDDGEVNAYATCGGHVYVTSALLHDVEDEAELAMVLGHEIAHNLDHHVTRADRKQQRLARGIPRELGLAAIPLYLFGAEGLLHLSREYEDEADEHGQKLAMRAGFDGGAQARLFERWKQREAKMPWLFRKLLGNHPSLDHRIRHARRHEFTGGLFSPVRRDPNPARFKAFKDALR
jgi:predicted Zn-dependent protease